MSTVLAEDWFNKQFVPFVNLSIPGNDPVLLLWDNCKAHNILGACAGSRFTIMELPENTTSVFQPLDQQGIIAALKMYYKKA
jgi:hypothetical protein